MINIRNMFLFIMIFCIIGCAQQTSYLSRNTICNFSKFNFIGSQNKNINFNNNFVFLTSYAEPDAEYLITKYDRTLSEYIEFNQYLNWQQIDIKNEQIKIYDNINNKINNGQAINEDLNTIVPRPNSKYIVLNFIKKFDAEVSNIENIYLPIINLLSAKTLYRNGFTSTLKIYDSNSALLIYDLSLVSFSDNNENRFNSDDSLYIDKTISYLICELYYFPKYKEKIKSLSLKNVTHEKLVLIEILDEYLNKKKRKSKNVYHISHNMDNNLMYFMTDNEIVNALEKFRKSGVIMNYSFNYRTTNLPGFNADLNPKFFQ